MRFLDAKRSMLIRDDIVFVIWVERLMPRRNTDLFGRQLHASKVLEHVGMMGRVKMEVREARIARLR